MHFILFRQSSIVSLFRVIACIYTFVALVPPHPVATWTYFTSQMLSVHANFKEHCKWAKK